MSNSYFDLGYTGLKVEDFSLFEGGTLVLTWIFRLKWGKGGGLNFLLMSFFNLGCNYTSFISLLHTFVLKIYVGLSL